MMKQIFALALCMVLVAALAGCQTGQTEGESSSSALPDATFSEHSVDVLAYVERGAIPGLKVELGTYIGTVKELYKEPEEGEHDEEEEDIDHDHGSFGIVIQDTYTEVKADVGEAYFFYKTRYEGKGISRIVCFSDPFDFTIGITMPEDILAAVKAQPVADEVVERVDFLPGTPDNFRRIGYMVGERGVDFYFADEFLSCVVLTDHRYWVEE